LGRCRWEDSKDEIGWSERREANLGVALHPAGRTFDKLHRDGSPAEDTHSVSSKLAPDTWREVDVVVQEDRYVIVTCGPLGETGERGGHQPENHGSKSANEVRFHGPRLGHSAGLFDAASVTPG